jgi:hypothetical protein
MSREDCAQLRLLLAAVPAYARDDDPDFIALLEAWEATGVTSEAAIPAYRTRSGWLVRSVADVLAIIAAETDP